MLKRHADYTSAKHWYHLGSYSRAWQASGVISLLSLAVAGVWYGYLWLAATDKYNAQMSVVTVLAQQTPENRRVVAGNLLWLYGQGMAPSALQDPEFRIVVDSVEQTGSGAWTTVYPASWDPFIYDWIPAWILAIFCAFSMMLGLVYYWHCKDQKHYLADLPWRRLWVWGFVLIAPVLWIPLVASSVRMRLKPPHVQPRPVRNKQAKPKRFTPDAASAKVAYWQMRTKGAATGQRLYREKVEQDLRDLQEECASLATALGEAQQKHLKLKVEHANLHETPDPEPPTDDLLEKEFERLLQLPGVSGVRANGAEGIMLLVAATIEHEEERYDLGTWKLRLDLSGSVEATEFKTGVLPSWDGGSPVYRIGKGFCFGDHDDLIEAHLIRGHILEAAALAVQALCTVNADDRHKIPQAFKRIGGKRA